MNRSSKTAALHERAAVMMGAQATPDSPEWARYAHERLLDLTGRDRSSKYAVTEYLGPLSMWRSYRFLAYPDGRPFETVHAYMAAPRPYGLGMAPGEINELETAVKGTSKALETGKSRNARPRGRPKSGEGNVDCSQHLDGNALPYLLRRVARQDEANGTDFLARYEQGEFSSARAVARAAGVKVSDPSPVVMLRYWWRKASAKDRRSFLDEVAS